MIELYSGLPLQYLEQRKHEIEDFKVNMFPEIEKALDDMGCTGTVEFTSSKSSPVGYDTVVIKAKKPGAVPMDAIVTVKFPSVHPKNLYTIQWKDANGVSNQDTALVGKALDVPGVVEVYFKEAFGESSESALPRIALHKKSEGAESLTLWQARATDAEAELKKKISEEFKDVKELRTECILHGNSLDTIAAAVLYWKDSRIISFEFSGRSKYTINWYALEGADYSGRVDSLAENPAAELVDENWDDIKDVIETFYIG